MSTMPTRGPATALLIFVVLYGVLVESVEITTKGLSQDATVTAQRVHHGLATPTKVQSTSPGSGSSAQGMQSPSRGANVASEERRQRSPDFTKGEERANHDLVSTFLTTKLALQTDKKGDTPVYLQKKKSRVRPACTWCRQLVLNAVDRGPTGKLIHLCTGSKEEHLVPMCTAFMTENEVRNFDWALDPSTVCVRLGSCTPTEAALSEKDDSRLAAERRAELKDMKIATGHTTVNKYLKSFAHMYNGFGMRHFRQRIQFKEPFHSRPYVSVGMFDFSLGPKSHLRYKIVVDLVDRYGFDVYITTWGTTKVAQIGISWLAYSKVYASKGMVRTGTYTVQEPSQAVETQRIHFPTTFINYPNVTTSITGMESFTGTGLGVKTWVTGVTRQGFNLNFQKQGLNTHIKWLRISWVATDRDSTHVQSAHIGLNSTIQGFGPFDGVQEGERSFEKLISFPKAYTVAPSVQVKLDSMRFRSGHTPELQLKVDHITPKGFIVAVLTTTNVRIPSVGLSWTAHYKPQDKGKIPGPPPLPTTGALNSPTNPAPSCRAIVLRRQSRGNGNYWIRLPDPDQKSNLMVYCDMENGGWTRVVNVKGSSYFHANNVAGFNTKNLPNAGQAAKLSDTHINMLNTVGYFRVVCGHYTAFVKNTENEWTCHLRNKLHWWVAKADPLKKQFTCQASSQGNVFSEKYDSDKTCSKDHMMYAAPIQLVGTGCFHTGEGWGQSGSVWAM